MDEAGERVVSRVNFETGRVRPSSSLDVSAGAILMKSPHRELRVQADVRNITNRLDVINFAGLFSGTALAPRRAFFAGLRLQFE